MAKAKTVAKVKRAARTPYLVSLKIMGRPYSSEAATLDAAFDKLAVRNAKGVSILTVSKGKLSRSRVLTPPQTFRLFSPSKLMRMASYKQMSQIFNF